MRDVSRQEARRRGRRSVLAGLVLGAAGAGGARADLPGSGAVPSPPPPARERWLWLRNSAGEEVALAYRRGQDYSIPAMVRIQHLLRDLRAETPGPVPALLLDMLSLIQERIGYTRPLQVISGYRTPQTNALLPHAAPNSLHMRGMAADIVVPGLPQSEICSHALLLSHQLGFMGIGWYGSFTHVDIGPKASWTKML
jgi:uncharacterized protein YcbK (DUF882 family)